mmetsp:Transcript_3426/g.10821  ORF Transcript_3426/g.10821 Transcript_3426/m.10821 type:complete len:320 (+) Transcript_3426:1123-2082(+)
MVTCEVPSGRDSSEANVTVTVRLRACCARLMPLPPAADADATERGGPAPAPMPAPPSPSPCAGTPTCCMAASEMRRCSTRDALNCSASAGNQVVARSSPEATPSACRPIMCVEMPHAASTGNASFLEPSRMRCSSVRMGSSDTASRGASRCLGGGASCTDMYTGVIWLSRVLTSMMRVTPTSPRPVPRKLAIRELRPGRRQAGNMTVQSCCSSCCRVRFSSVPRPLDASRISPTFPCMSPERMAEAVASSIRSSASVTIAPISSFRIARSRRFASPSSMRAARFSYSAAAAASLMRWVRKSAYECSSGGLSGWILSMDL